MIDEDTLQTHDISEALSDEVECEKCGKVNWLEEVLICSEGGSNDSDDKDRTHKSEQGSIFGRIVEVSATGTEKKVGKKTRTTISYNFDRNVAPWSSLKNDLAAFGLDDEAVEKAATHDDLVKRFAPFRLDVSEYADEAEYANAVLKKQAEDADVDMPDEYKPEGNGSRRSTGGLPWKRKSRS